MKRLHSELCFKLPVLLLICIARLNMTYAQSVLSPHRNVVGTHDAELPYPVIEGKPGQKDMEALKEIGRSLLESSPLEWPGIEANGTIIVGSEGKQQWPASVTIEKNGQFRMDVQTPLGENSLRISNGIRAVRKPSGKLELLPASIVAGPFVLPSQVWEAVNRRDVSVLDDGFVIVDKIRMRKITLAGPSLPSSNHESRGLGETTSMTLYFDPANHHLLKTVCIDHYPGNASHEFLQVVTYSDFRPVQGSTVPFTYSETNNGQLGLIFKADEIKVAIQHTDSYFHF